MHKKLEEIINKTKEDLIIRKQQVSFDSLKVSIKITTTNPFVKAIKKYQKGSIAVIAEIKLASPTQPNLGSKEDILSRAKSYESAGADAISIVTEKHFFNGDISYIKKIKEVSDLPILQKDFILDAYQIYEAKKVNADAILLIARILSAEDIISLVNVAQEIGINPVVEINSKEDLTKALATNTEIIAANARDLDSFEVSIDRACELIRLIPSSFIKLGFSGIAEKKDAEKYKNAGADGILIGTSLMKSQDISSFLKKVRI